MRKSTLYSVEKILLAVAAILLVAVLVLAATAQTVTVQSRPDGKFTTVEDAVLSSREDADAPTGVIDEYRFPLGRLGHADTLVFFVNHNNIAVYLADECVFTLTEEDDVFRTVGATWVTIPLFENDAGKEVRVELAPIYNNYREKAVVFYFGSELAIWQAAFTRAIPELLMCLSIVLVGLFLLALAIYHTAKRISHPSRVYAIAFLTLSVGIWRFTYGQFAYYLFDGHSVLLYTLSIASLMTLAISMLKCVEQPPEEDNSAIRFASVCYCAVYIVQLVLQAAGILDLRQTLTVVHVMLVISAVVLCVNGVVMWLRTSGGILRRNNAWILSIGVVADLLIYYLAESDTGVLCTLGAVLCFALLEGVRLLIGFSEQRNALAEMETQLTLSRTVTMMSQIRSHFVFNILNAISGMCKYDPEKADETVVRFARYLRNNIDIMENDKNIPFSVDLRQLEDYVALEKVRFGDKITFRTEIETDKFLLPPLILQPVVENAIKHGVSKKLTDGTITLRTRDTGESIVITVEDDGVGFRPEELDKEKSVGLRNIRFRLQHLVNGTLDRGTTVTITIPKKENASCT